MKGSQQQDADLVHHRLLEGILLRLVRLPEAERFILRGGMLMRLWFRPHIRLAADLDLVCTLPFNVEETARRFLPILTDRGVDDGVVFDSERYRIEGIWLNTASPGVRLFACGTVEGVEDDLNIDVTFGEPLIPLPEPGGYPMLARGLTARLWMCRPETITGRKLHALMHMGMLHWRPKDLNDLRLLLRIVPMNAADLPTAIAASFTSRGNTTADARSLFQRDGWWTLKRAAARWQEFVHECGDRSVPRDLSRVVAEVAERLAPILEQLP